MDMETMVGLGRFGAAAALGFAAIGSSLGVGAAGPAAVGAWKKCLAQGKAAPFLLITFIAAPLSQTIYGMIVMNKMYELAAKGQYLWGIGAFAGAAIGLSAYWQGKCAASACDAMGETNKGFGNYLVVLGMTETVALFVMAFTLGILGKLAGS